MTGSRSERGNSWANKTGQLGKIANWANIYLLGKVLELKVLILPDKFENLAGFLRNQAHFLASGQW